MGINQSVPRARKLDQFYTNPLYADDFYQKIAQHVDLNLAEILLEPSAGSGSFYNLLDPKRRVGLDLDPKAQGVLLQDFLSWRPSGNTSVYTIGNPPFGKNSSLAVKFFNHAAKFSEVIAFVLPRTFRKASIQNRLDDRFHLIYDETVPDNSFVFDGGAYDVWCCAQIWVKRDGAHRAKVPILSVDSVRNWLEIVDPRDADFAIQRVGLRAGQIRTSEFRDYSQQSHYFIKQHDPRVLPIFQSLDFEPVKFNTAGNPSVSPSELVTLWSQAAAQQGIAVAADTDAAQAIFSDLFIE